MFQNPNPNNVPDATKGASDSVAAPGCVGVRGTNVPAWMSIADFLTHQNLRIVLKARARSSEAAGAVDAPRGAGAAQGAEVQTLPVGNHGEIVLQGARHD